MGKKSEIQEILEEHRSEILERLANRQPPARVDWKGWIVVSLAVLGVVVAFTTSTFKANAAADLEHEKIRTTQALDSQAHTQRLNTQGDSVEKILTKLEVVLANQILIGERVRAAGLRVNQDIDEGD